MAGFFDDYSVIETGREGESATDAGGGGDPYFSTHQFDQPSVD